MDRTAQGEDWQAHFRLALKIIESTKIDANASLFLGNTLSINKSIFITAELRPVRMKGAGARLRKVYVVTLGAIDFHEMHQPLTIDFKELSQHTNIRQAINAALRHILDVETQWKEKLAQMPTLEETKRKQAKDPTYILAHQPITRMDLFVLTQVMISRRVNKINKDVNHSVRKLLYLGMIEEEEVPFSKVKILRESVYGYEYINRLLQVIPTVETRDWAIKPKGEIMKRQYHCYADPGHSWLKVPIKELETLGIAGMITGYSYMRNGYAYLEEDCDVATFAAAREVSHLPSEWIIWHHTNRQSKIRSYEHYKYEGGKHYEGSDQHQNG